MLRAIVTIKSKILFHNNSRRYDMDNKNINTLRDTIASLETKVDFFEAELSYIHMLLTQIGFPDGVQGLKVTIEELLDTEEQMHNRDRFPED